jgi:hypothetical protein
VGDVVAAGALENTKFDVRRSRRREEAESLENCKLSVSFPRRLRIADPELGFQLIRIIAASTFCCGPELSTYLLVESGQHGTVVAWGNNISGHNDIPSGVTNVIAIADGVDHCLAIVATPTPQVLSNPHWQNGVFTVSVPTQTGKRYQLQYLTGLSGSAWTSLPPVTGTGSNLTLTDTSAPATQRFYRVSEQ